MGNTCKPLAVSFQCMTKSTTNKKKKKRKKKNKQSNGTEAANGWAVLQDEQRRLGGKSGA